MATLQVGLVNRSYPIRIKRGSLNCCGQLVADTLRGKKICVVTDSNVGPIYAETVLESFRNAGFLTSLLTIPAGETSKTPQQLAFLWEELARLGLTRADCVAALGGGVVGDLTGFAAATFLRGVDFVQIPTTLLSQVDSSVGGKVAVDLQAGKNLAGCFYQPRLVIMDPDTLATLPNRVFSDGMAEVIKYGCIWDRAFFDILASLDGRTGVEARLEEILYTCCDIKRRVVEEDEFDTGLRMILNFGHTFGHVYEKAYHYETYTHGEAVGAGMVTAAAVGQKLGKTPYGTDIQIAEVLGRYGLPTSIEAPFYEFETTMSLDKKSLGGDIHLILLEKLGKAAAVKLQKSQVLDLLK